MDEDTVPKTELDQARKSLLDSERAREADASILAYAGGIVDRLREERATNGWAEKVRARFRETKGAA